MQNSTKTNSKQTKEFKDLVNTLKQVLSLELEQNKIEAKDVLTLLLMFSTAETEYEIKLLVELFIKDFPVLQHLKTKIDQKEKIKLDKEIEEIVRNLIKENPLKAAQVASMASRKGITKEEIKKHFPELFKK